MIWRDLAVAVRESSRRKTMHIVIERDGSLAVQVPNGLDAKKILTVLESRAYEVFRMLERWKDAHRGAVKHMFSEGEQFPLAGRNYPLRFVAGQDASVVFAKNEFRLRAGDDNPRESMKRFYRAIGRDRILKRLQIYAPRFAASPKKVHIRDMQTRWGSCTPSGVISYNWRCVLVPVPVMDYLIVHELAHLEHHRHSREFWNHVATILPRFEDSVRWLQKNGVKTEL